MQGKFLSQVDNTNYDVLDNQTISKFIWKAIEEGRQQKQKDNEFFLNNVDKLIEASDKIISDLRADNTELITEMQELEQENMDKEDEIFELKKNADVAILGYSVLDVVSRMNSLEDQMKDLKEMVGNKPKSDVQPPIKMDDDPDYFVREIDDTGGTGLVYKIETDQEAVRFTASNGTYNDYIELPLGITYDLLAGSLPDNTRF